MTLEAGDRPVKLARAALPIVAIVSFVLGVGAALASAGDTLGFDFLAYHQAVTRVLDGQPLYDMSYVTSGGFGLFYYPPTFAVLVAPLALLSAATATWVWVAILIAVFLAGVTILPVSRNVRWWTLLLAGWSFPFVYAVKLGQVGPILFTLFAIGWRWIDSPVAVGVSGALGAAIKIQPGLIFVWALLTRRYRAVLYGAVTLLALGALATVLAGFGAWPDFLTLVRTVTDPIVTVHNFTPGAVAYQLGMAPEYASLLQFASTIAVAVIWVVAIRTGTDEASYLVTVIVTQLVSPILWDHYAMLLLLPVAYLLAAGRWWALVIPLVSAWPLVGITPPIVYPLAFWVTLIALTVVGRRAQSLQVHPQAMTA